MQNEVEITKTKSKKSVLALISLVLGAIYLVFIITYFAGGLSSSQSGSEAVGRAIASALVLPHILCVLIAVLFNALGYFMNRRAFVLVGAIMYAVSMVLFLIYFMFVIIQMILSFIAYARMPKTE